MKQLIAAAGAVLLLGPSALADNLALIVGNNDYAHAPDAETAARDARSVAKALRDAGWDVTLGTDLDRSKMRDLIRAFAGKVGSADRLVIYYSGHALRTGGATYLAPVDTRANTLTDVIFDGVPLDLLFRTAAEKAGSAVIFLDGAQLRGFTPTDFVEPGLAALEGPEGVVIVSAAEPGKAIRRSAWRDSRFSQLITSRFLQPGAAVMDSAAAAWTPTYVIGEADADFVLVPAPKSVTGDEDGLGREIELAYWRTAERSGKAEDYRAYLERYPEGVFAAFARDRLGIGAAAAAPEEPKVDPKVAAEAALNLSRIRKRKIQEWLLALGHNPRGIDGLFGRGSRAAIRGWQRASGLEQTGYLDKDQLSRLNREGEAALAEQRRIAEEKRRIAEAEDNGYWSATGARGNVAGYRAYLERYPQGLHAAAARAALDKVAEAEADEAARIERRRFRRASAPRHARGISRLSGDLSAGDLRGQGARPLGRTGGSRTGASGAGEPRQCGGGAEPHGQ